MTAQQAGLPGLPPASAGAKKGVAEIDPIEEIVATKFRYFLIKAK